jgi:hypothetical protein
MLQLHPTNTMTILLPTRQCKHQACHVAVALATVFQQLILRQPSSILALQATSDALPAHKPDCCPLPACQTPCRQQRAQEFLDCHMIKLGTARMQHLHTYSKAQHNLDYTQRCMLLNSCCTEQSHIHFPNASTYTTWF